MTKHLLSLLIGLTCLTGCQPTADAPPSFQIGPVPPRSFAEQWEARLPMRGDEIKRMYVRDPYLFVYSEDNRVYSLQLSSGVLGRSFRPIEANRRLFPPIVTAEEVLFPTHTAIKAYAREGAKQRTMDLGVSISTPAVENDGRLYFGTDFARGGRMMEADTTRTYGFLGWQVMTLGGLSAAPALHTDVLYFGSEDGHVYAVTTDQQQAWPLERSSFDARGRVVADVKVDDYAVYAAVETGVLYALDRSNGKVKWQYFAERPLRTSPVIGATQVYQQVPRVGLVAIDKLKGLFSRQPVWVAKDAVQVVSMDNDHVYVRLRDNSIAALDKATGEQRFKSKRSDFDVFALNSKDSTIYAATSEGYVYAITPVLKPGVVGELVLNVSPLPITRSGS